MTDPIVIPHDDSSNLKQCSKCGEWKPREAFHKERQHTDGLKSHCKSCQSELARRYREANPDKVRARNRASYAANAEQRKQYSREWRAANPDRVRTYSKCYYDTHKHELREKGIRYKEANAETLKQYYRDSYAANRDNRRREARERRARNVERARKSARAWQRANPESGRLYTSRRRAREHNLPDAFTSTDWQAALDHFGGCCAACGRPPGLWHTLAQDHWIPLSAPDCPGSVPWNIVPLCHATRDGEGGCNNSKFNRGAGEWLAEQFGKRKGRAIQRRVEGWLATKR